jgi:hypothetical protein
VLPLFNLKKIIMAIAISFTPASMNTEQYDECIRRLQTAEAGAPAGRSFHACYGSGDQLYVFDVWDTMESFEKFGETLMPIFVDIGNRCGTAGCERNS